LDEIAEVIAMTQVDRLRPLHRAVHNEEWLSILVCVLGTAAAVYFIWTEPDYVPTSGPAWALPVWIGFIYVLVQIVFLLVSATQIRFLGVIDSILSILPVIAGGVITVEWMLGHLSLSGYQGMSLTALLVAGTSEFLLTLWIRFVLNRRTFAIDTSV
jgi:hypothetical protein